MEIRKKKISLAGLFGRYIFMFVTGTFFAALISGAVMFFLILIPSGPFLPANYAEQQLINTKETLQEADITEEEMIPSGSLYGVFDREGSFLYGTFDEEVQKDAWIKQILYTLREKDIIFLWKKITVKSVLSSILLPCAMQKKN